MRILISNDDGILAPGLAALVGAVRDLGETVVVAPATHQSGAGQGITVTRALTVRQVRVRGDVEFSGTSIDGRPADCTRLALRELLDEPPDLVLSGINRGANVGIHVFYSGTVAAAAEGALAGVPSVSFSAAVDGDREPDFLAAGRLCRWVLETLLDRGLTPGDLLNVNIPDLHGAAARGLRVVPQSVAGFEETYLRDRDDAGRDTYALGEYRVIPSEFDNDVDSLHAGWITVTPLKVDRTDRTRLAELADGDWRLPVA